MSQHSNEWSLRVSPQFPSTTKLCFQPVLWLQFPPPTPAFRCEVLAARRSNSEADRAKEPKTWLPSGWRRWKFRQMLVTKATKRK